MSLTSSGIDLGPFRYTERDPVEPTGYGMTQADRAGLANEEQERGLEGILGVVRVAEHVLADTEHHRAMALDQGGEGGRRFIARAGEVLHQLPIGQAGERSLLEEGS
jgi:hypothetical protein